VTGWRPLGGALVLLLTLCVLAACGSDDDSEAEKGQVVRFQTPTAKGPDPFTARATDVQGPDRVEVGSGPYGGTGSDLVCDRELLIKSLKARPERLRAWAKVLDLPGGWTDCDAFDAALEQSRRQDALVALNLSTQDEGHVIAASPLGAYMDHMKGGRKEIGYSPERFKVRQWLRAIYRKPLEVLGLLPLARAIRSLFRGKSSARELP